jgi:acetyltransferase
MAATNLNKFFNPYRIAVMGAANDPALTGYIVLRNMIHSGFRGIVYPVNPARESVQGIQCYPNVASLPKRPDLAVVCTPMAHIPAMVRECGERDVQGVLVISPEFGEDSAKDTVLEQQISDLLKEFSDLRLIGPNTLGIISPSIGLNASLSDSMPKPGPLAFLSQSGALANAILDRAVERGIGLSHCVSIGNTLDVNFGDLIDYFGTDYHTRAIILYIESIAESRGFMSAARAFAKIKPIVAYKAGQYRYVTQMATSHTAAMVDENAVYEAAFQRAGIVRAMELDDVFEVAQLLACHRFPHGARLAIISNAGAAAVVATEALRAHRGIPAAFSQSTLKRLQDKLPLCQVTGNSVDLTDRAVPESFSDAVNIVTADAKVDAVLVVLTPQPSNHPTKTAERLGALAEKVRKPILTAWLGGSKVRAGIQALNRAGLPTHSSPEHAVRAFMHLVTYARNLNLLYETPRDIPVNFTLDRRQLRNELNHLVTGERGFLTDYQTKRLLQAYGIPTCATLEAYSIKEAVRLATRQIGTPVALKVLSTPQVAHKADVGGVALNLRNAGEIRRAYDYIVESVSTHRPDVEVNGVTVQEMIHVQNGFEMILGAKKDPTFGSVIMIGMGGLATGIYQDRALSLPPINERLAWHMLESLRTWPLLQGYRGQPGIDVDRLIEILMRFSYLVADYPELLVIDINPLMVSQADVVALDAMTLLDRHCQRQPNKPYPHLAIRPYPEEYTRQAVLKNHTPVKLRPIRPEDEPLWGELLKSVSPTSIRLRFRSMLKHEQVNHDMATRHCYIDYEREITIIGELEVIGHRKIIGVGSLSAMADEGVAEFAVLVADDWQSRGLGGMLLDYCIEIAKSRGIRRIIAETDPKNRRMITVFEKRGFSSRVSIEDDAVYLHRQL